MPKAETTPRRRYTRHAGDIHDTEFLLQCQMLKLASILKKIPKGVRVSDHQGSGSHDRKLHQAFLLSRGGGIGPKSITLKSEMANHNSRVNLIAVLYSRLTSFESAECRHQKITAVLEVCNDLAITIFHFFPGAIESSSRNTLLPVTRSSSTIGATRLRSIRL